ncbi:MAG TPA: MFS transporter [Intrasporangium sp.]|uniref:MFS transporter n=1 Tax=Intrasporangium sp. TaxID=1925024 RepID=UPI002B46504F|nr:MFS transporter [Intrasporangium sp.]HKX68436.1 MFS transporter [Intrasporangium sp.]
MALGAPFWRFWCAAVLANVGDGIRLAAFPLLAASLTTSPAAVGFVAAAAALPWLVTGLAAGSLADRRGARALLVISDVVRISVLIVLVGALFTGVVSVALVAVVSFVLGVAETVRDTAAQTVIPRLVSPAQLERANSRLVAGELAGNEFVGPLVGGSLFAVGAALPFISNSAALAIGVLLVLSVPAALLTLPDPGDEPGDAIATGVQAGLAWLGRHRTLRTLMLAAAFVALADSAWFAIFVLYTEARLDLGAVGFSMLLAVGALGGLAGAWAADRLIAGHRHDRVLLGSMAVTTMAPALLVVSGTVWAAVVVVVVTSGAFGVFNVAGASLRHRMVPYRVLGRVVATWRTVVYGAGALGAVAGGVLASARGLQAPFVLSAALGLIAVAMWWRAIQEPGASA